MQMLHVNGDDMAYLEVGQETARRWSACMARCAISGSGRRCWGRWRETIA